MNGREEQSGPSWVGPDTGPVPAGQAPDAGPADPSAATERLDPQAVTPTQLFAPGPGQPSGAAPPAPVPPAPGAFAAPPATPQYPWGQPPGHPGAGHPSGGAPGHPFVEQPYAGAPQPYAGAPQPYAGAPQPGGVPPFGAYPPPVPGQHEVLQAGAVPGGPRGRGRTVGVVVGVLVVALLVVGGGVVAFRRYLDGNVPEAGWQGPVNAYCRSADRDLKAATRSAPDDVTRLDALSGAIRTMNGHLRDQKVPRSKSADYDAMVGHWDQVSRSYADAVAAARRGDEQGANAAVTRADAANDQGNAIAKQLGLPDCAGAGGLPEPGQPSAPGTGGPSPSAVA